VFDYEPASEVTGYYRMKYIQLMVGYVRNTMVAGRWLFVLQHQVETNHC